MWTPKPTVLFGIDPIAIRIEIFRAPNVFVEILRLRAKELREISVALANPCIDRVGRTGGEQIPIAGVRAGDDEFSRTAVAKRETRSV